MKRKILKVKKQVFTYIVISALILTTVAGVLNFGVSAYAAAVNDTSAAEYGETLADQTPDSITSKTWAWTPTDKTGWSWVDPSTDFFGESGEQTFVIKKGSGSSTAYNAITVYVKPREVEPILIVNGLGSSAPSDWAGNVNKAKTTDSSYKMTITATSNNTSMGTVSGGGTYWKGQPFILTATPKTGYKLNGWNGGSSGTSTILKVSNVYDSMSYAATFEASNTMVVTLSLPTKPGDVSIMTLEQAVTVLSGSNSSPGYGYDPTKGYTTSTYYIYAINDTAGSNDATTKSTISNLQSVGLSWYQQLKKPITIDNHWSVGSHKVIGGPLYYVYADGYGGYGLEWYYSESGVGYSHNGNCWGNTASGAAYVAIVNAANTMEVTQSLPAVLGNVSIMTLEEAHVALGGPIGVAGSGTDPRLGYDTATYHMYAINDTTGTNDSASVSTVTNLQAVGLDWYKQLNKPTTSNNHWANAGNGSHSVFGGPLSGTYHFDNGKYRFSWYCADRGIYPTNNNNYWRTGALGSVYVAVVRAH